MRSICTSTCNVILVLWTVEFESLVINRKQPQLTTPNNLTSIFQIEDRDSTMDNNKLYSLTEFAERQTERHIERQRARLRERERILKLCTKKLTGVDSRKFLSSRTVLLTNTFNKLIMDEEDKCHSDVLEDFPNCYPMSTEEAEDTTSSSRAIEFGFDSWSCAEELERMEAEEKDTDTEISSRSLEFGFQSWSCAEELEQVEAEEICKRSSRSIGTWSWAEQVELEKANADSRASS